MYSNEAQSLLRTALRDVVSVEYLRRVLRDSWRRRAQRYFDGRDRQQSAYIVHRYNVDHATSGDFGAFYTYRDTTFTFIFRRFESYDVRNPAASPDSIHTLSKIHGARTGHSSTTVV